MKKTIFYQITIILFILYGFIFHHTVTMPQWYLDKLLVVHCGLMGALGGSLYCIRSIYINKCVNKLWDENWELWYYLRPFSSLISGVISYVFLKAGLLALDVSGGEGNTYGYLAISFLAGYSVDNFTKKLEAIMQSALGSSKHSDTNNS